MERFEGRVVVVTAPGRSSRPPWTPSARAAIADMPAPPTRDQGAIFADLAGF